MKKRLLYLALALIAAPLLWGQSTVVCTTASPGTVIGSCASGFSSPVTTDPVSATGVWTFDNAANTPITCSDGLIDSTLTAGRVTFAGASGRLSDSAVLTGGATVANDNSTNFLRVVGTMPTTPSTSVAASQWTIASAGSASQTQAGLWIDFTAGYTGNQASYGIISQNTVASTGGNVGVFGSATSTSGTLTNRGVYGQGGSGGLNVTGVGLTGLGNGGLSAIGADLTANTATNQIGLRATLGLTPSTATSAVILADNASVAAPIAIFRDNGTAVFTLGDGGTTSLIAGTGTGRVSLGGVLCKGAPAAATAGTSEEVLATCTIPANTLSANGATLRVKVFAHTAANGNNKTIRARVGGIAGVIVADSSAIAANNLDFSVDSLDVRRLSATTATAYASFIRGTDSATSGSIGGTYSMVRAAAITWANSNDLVITGTTPTAAGDLTLDTYSVEVVQ